MEIKIIRKNQQAAGQFNNGEILENKPIGFPREGGHLKPYSNLFYWSHAWSKGGSTIGLHPHQGFEILSFVLKNSIEHYDTAGNEWKPLHKGDAQIIRAGNGISHSEKINPGGDMFQIWFDPNLEKTIQQNASYDDFSSDSFPTELHNGINSKTYVGKDSPLQMESEGVEIKQLIIPEGESSLQLDDNQYHSFYLVEGNIVLENESLTKDDFFIVKEAALVFTAKVKTTLFLISNPRELTYQTYSQKFN